MTERLPRKNSDIEDPLEQLDARFVEAGGDYEKAWASLDREEAAFVIKQYYICLTNPRYYLENYHFIRTKKAIIQPIWPFFDSQEMLMDSVMRQFDAQLPIRVICLKARQMGITSMGVALMCWLVFLHPNVHVMSMSDEENKVDVNFGMARIAYANLPWWMVPEKRYDIRGQLLGFDRSKERQGLNKGLQSLLYFESANQPSGAAYSKSLFGSHLAEVARYRNSNSITEGIFGSLVNFPRSIGLMESTARGRGNPWHTICRAAQSKGLDWDFLFLEWIREPGYSIAVPANFVRTPEEESIAKKCQTQQKYTMSDGQFAWRRKKMDEFEAIDGDPEKFFQEFPLCLVESTLCSTNRGIGTMKWALGSEYTESGRILAGGPQPASQVFRLTTVLGRELVGTADHPVKTVNGFSGLSELKPGQMIELRSPMFADVEFQYRGLTVTQELARFIGLFIGDGSWDFKRGVMSLCCDSKDKDVVDEVCRLTKIYAGNPRPRKVGSAGGGTEVRMSRKAFHQTLVDLDCITIDPDTGRWKKKVGVPESIFRSPRHAVREFLRGLFEADGSASNNAVRFYSKSLRFAREVQLLLLGFGINGRINQENRIVGENGYRGWQINLRSGGSRLFAETIGFLGKRKQLLAEFRAKRTDSFSWMPDGMYDAVKVVEPAGREITYDLTVEGDHVFSANGILTHNTPAEAFIASGRCAFSKRRLYRMSSEFAKPPIWIGEVRLDEMDDKTPRMSQQEEGRFRIWEKPLPQKKGTYYIAADPSMGIDGGDYACAQVYIVPEDIKQPLRQVARWHGYCPPTQFARVIAAMGYYYNTAEICPECNTITTVASDLVKVLMYPKWYRWMREDKARNAYSNWIGWQTTFRNKSELIGRFREALDEWTVIVYCEEDIDEMLDFVEEEEGTGRYSGRKHDDAVMAHMICYYAATQLRPRKAGIPDETAPPKDQDFQNTDFSPIYDNDQPIEGDFPDFAML